MAWRLRNQGNELHAKQDSPEPHPARGPPSAADPGAGLSHQTTAAMVALLVALPDCVLAAPDLTCCHLWNRVQGRLVRLDRLMSCVCTDHGETGKVPLRCLPLQGRVEFMPWFNPWGSPQRGKGFRYWLVKKWQMCTTGLEEMQQAFRRK